MRRLLLFVLGCGIVPAVAQKIEYPAPAISVNYTAMRANAGPGQCGCFTMNGGTAELSIPIRAGLDAVADVGGTTAPGVNGLSTGLSLLTYTAGGRVVFSRRKIGPFVQATVGGVHGFKSFFPTPSGSQSATGFAFLAGGGLDVRVSPILAIRPFQVDYLQTRLPNAASGVQNNMRYSAGVVLTLR